VVPGLAVNDVSVVEGNSGTTSLVFTVTLSAASTKTVTVNYATANGTATAGGDYTATSGTLTFAAGVRTQTVTVSTWGDTTSEGNETLMLNLSGAVNAAILDNQGIGTILNDDVTLPSISINNVAIKEGDSGYTNMIFTLSLSAASKQSVSVSFNTIDGTATAGSDYLAASGTVTFAAGQTKQTIAVRIYGDSVYEANESFSLQLSNPTNAQLGASRGVGTIQNDDRSKLVGPAGKLSTEFLMAAYGDYFDTALATLNDGKSLKTK